MSTLQPIRSAVMLNLCYIIIFIESFFFLACNPRQGMPQGTSTLRIQALWLQVGGKDIFTILILYCIYVQHVVTHCCKQLHSAIAFALGPVKS